MGRRTNRRYPIVMMLAVLTLALPTVALADDDDDGKRLVVTSGKSTLVSVTGGRTWRAATLVRPYYLWAQPLKGSSWVTVRRDRLNRGADAPARSFRYRHPFSLPADCEQASLRFYLHADNDALLFLNGRPIGMTRLGDHQATFQGAPEGPYASSNLRGRNVLEMRTRDFGIVTGVDYRGVVTCSENDDDEDEDDGDDDDKEEEDDD